MKGINDINDMHKSGSQNRPPHPKGGVDAIIKADFRYFYMDMVGGALSGFSRTLAVNAVFGAPYKTVSINGIQGIYRTGGLSNFINNKILPKPMGDGLTLGTDMYIREGDGDYVTMNHEGYHIDQQVKMGWAVFYGGIIGEYITQGSKNGPIEREAYDFQNKHDHLNW